MTDAAELRAIVREELAGLLGKPKKSHDSRPQLIVRVEPEEIALVDAAAQQRGVTRSAFVRDAVAAALGTALRQPGPIPPGFNRRKPSRFDDGKSDLREIDRAALTAKAREGIIATRQIHALNAAAGAATSAPYQRGMMAETTDAPSVPSGKLSD